MRAADRIEAWLEGVGALSELGVDPTILAFALAAVLLGLALWVGWRRPALLFVPALASLAIRPQLLWGDRNLGYEWGLSQTLLVLALLANALHFGVRRSINWPILALIVVFCLNLLLGNLHRDLTMSLMLTGLSLLALPFAFTQVTLDPASRPVCALVIAFAPLLSVAIGAVLQVLGIHTMFLSINDRLEGATGNAAIFGALAFAGFAVALHESTTGPQGRTWLLALAGINFALVVLSGTRMSLLATAVLLLAYTLGSERFRVRLRRGRAAGLVAIGLSGAALAIYAPTLYVRVHADLGRFGIWARFYDEFRRSPMFGRGIGSEYIAPNPLELLFAAPHNEYVHLLVIGGIFGFVMCMAAIVAWYLNLIRTAAPHDRSFLVALAPAIALYALTDNILVYSTGLALYAYLGVVRQSGDLQALPPIAETCVQLNVTNMTERSEAQGVSLRP